MKTPAGGFAAPAPTDASAPPYAADNRTANARTRPCDYEKINIEERNPQA